MKPSDYIAGRISGVLPKKRKLGRFVWEEEHFNPEKLTIPDRFRIGPKKENYIAITETGLKRGGSWIMELCVVYPEPCEEAIDIKVREFYYLPHGIFRMLDWYCGEDLKRYREVHNAEVNGLDFSWITIKPGGSVYRLFVIENNFVMSSGDEWAAMDIHLVKSPEPFAIPFKYYLNGEYITTVEGQDGYGIIIRRDMLRNPKLYLYRGSDM